MPAETCFLTTKDFTILEVMLATGVMAFAISTAVVTIQSAFLSLDTARNTSGLPGGRARNWAAG